MKVRELLHRTPTKELVIKKYSCVQATSIIKASYEESMLRCKQACVNYNKKYSCPPHSPEFGNFFGDVSKVEVVMYLISLDQYAPLNHYQRIKASNSVLKSILDKELLKYKESGLVVAGTGSCRACKPCGAKEDHPCKKPERIIYSLEALGVDVNALVEQCFGFSLEWYKKGEPAPKITCVVGAVAAAAD